MERAYDLYILLLGIVVVLVVRPMLSQWIATTKTTC